MNPITYGYIRVSAWDQNEDRQRIAMREAGIDDRNVFMDKQSEKSFERPGYRRLLNISLKTFQKWINTDRAEKG